MKTPLTIFSTDWHLTDTNIDLIKDLIRQKIELAQKHSIKRVYALGDLFDSRKAQKMITLIAFGEILNMFHKAKIKLVAIAGNHDKTDYESEYSFLEPFRHHPAFELVETESVYEEGNFLFFLLSYFKENTVLPNYLNFNVAKLSEKKCYLLTHIAISGVVNNDGSKVESELKQTKFSEFQKVFVGHYHDPQSFGNIHYIGSIAQNNFGENYKKGFTLFYSDGSHELIESVFPKYTTFEFDMDADDFEAVLEQYSNEHVNSKDNIRFVLIGAVNALKSLKIDYLKENGIDVKIKAKEVTEKKYQSTQFEEYNDNTIRNAFAEYCEEESLDYKTGEKYLN